MCSYSYNKNHPNGKSGTKFKVLTLAEETNDITLALEGIQVCLDSLLTVVITDKIALDFLLAGHLKVCVIAKTSCCA